MRRLRRGSALSDIARLSVCLASLGLAAALAGCAGDRGDRVYGYHLSGERPSSAEEDAIIGQAIVAHEMRRP